MESKRAVLVSVAHFEPGSGLRRRPGASRDTKRLHKTLSGLGFRVELHTDLDQDQIYSLFLTESRRPVRDCFLAVLSTHGDEGVVFGADGKPVQLSRVFSYFDNDVMETKVKLFLIQACRGSGLDDGVEVDSVDSVDSVDPRGTSVSQHLSIPVDTAVMFATTAGYGAFMHPLGSVFLQTFCSVLKDHRNLELTRVLTRLAQRVAADFTARGGVLAGKKEMPCLMSRLTRDVFPFAEDGKDGVDGVDGVDGLDAKASEEAGLSATSLVANGDAATWSPSIS